MTVRPGFARSALALALAAGALAGCATTATGPAEVTRFHDPARLASLGQTTVFIEGAPGTDANTLALSPYRQALADELRELGYREAPRGQARIVAQFALDSYLAGADGRRSPVSVGVGGSTGSYGSGVGLGIGINLGGGGGQRRGNELAVTMREAATGQSIWEGRARLEYPARRPAGDTAGVARILTDALFRQFPGQNGETVTVAVPR